MTDLLAELTTGTSVGVVGPEPLRAALAEALGDAWVHAGRVADAVWLPVRVDGPHVRIGPLVRPGVPGCDTCAERRWAANRPDHDGWAALCREFGDDPVDAPNPLVTPLTTHAVVEVVRDELARDDGRTVGAVLLLSLATGLITRHVLLPDPLCPDCANLPDDGPWVVRRRPLPKPDPATLRTTRLDGRWPDLAHSFVDSRTGVIASLSAGAPHGIPTAVARLGPPTSHESRHGYGRSRDFRSARLTAITEALERYGNHRPLGRRTAVTAPYTEVADRAVDPRTLGLYPDDWYDRPGFPFDRFDPDRPLAWVWGFSFGRSEPVLVPESYAYYGARTPAQDNRLVYECSNGCALGGCFEEAVLHGLLEVAERDAFLMTWYARMPVPELDLASARDKRIPVVAEFVRQRLGYTMTAYSITLEQRVPAVMVLGTDTLRRTDVPRHAFSAAAHPDPERALLTALIDAAAGIGRRMGAFDADKAARMLADPDEVREMSDHGLLYGHPGTADRLSFLGGSALSLPELRARTAWPVHHDLADDLAEAVRRYTDSGLDVIAVETTTPEHRAGGFAAAKVVVPGTLSMTFGHRHRRTHGLPRLHTVPRLLGHHPGPLNPHPHPFP
ncbi:TOMM precursor leader peptide-binding protein [Saccharothrix variisporea]|uniref:Ribosomal protein S12 methylthiotransferase accessory factor n=1 Tax=Saccharothrix variisporea TaxID=543527 RepID=A0A495WZY6_9PSEU|nr:TOMM precursor leader peptide-binding protein [Saccharothrix variisporea]RKT66866.1 ribosomal protein S12 methylthiotransferase accessory factor [Saccharothrix variisporea]